MSKTLIIGCGYAGERIARQHLERGDAVTACTRDRDRAARLREAGAEVLHIDLDGSGPPTFPAAARVYYLAPPPSSGVTDTRLARALRCLPAAGSLIYFSTTSVYGDHDGKRVDEHSPLAPSSDRARRRLDAERQVRAWCKTNDSIRVILRVAAIYGPGRLPLMQLAEGRPVADATSGPGNRIHVDDLAAAAMAVANAGDNGTWNISDGNPLPTATFNDLVADLAGLPRPRRVPPNSAELSAGKREFLESSRRIDNRKLLAVPGFRLRYANPADGIRASLHD